VTLDSELHAVAERLRRITVEVRAGPAGNGSGVIWGGDGLIISNAHVARTRDLEVELWDGRRFDARLRWRDPRRDLALLTIPARGLDAAVPARPGLLRAGELVLALGHPFGLSGLSAGVLHTSVTPRDRWIQADIRLAPGNSGGPLANGAGEVLGINTLIAGGLACAIPSRVVERFLIETGERAA